MLLPAPWLDLFGVMLTMPAGEVRVGDAAQVLRADIRHRAESRIRLGCDVQQGLQAGHGSHSGIVQEGEWRWTASIDGRAGPASLTGRCSEGLSGAVVS